MNENNLVYITDDGYVLPTRISIKSAIVNYGGECLNIFIIAVDVSEKNQIVLSSLNEIRKNVTVTVINKDDAYNELGVSHFYVSSAALYKFQLPKIFPDISKILYVDGDTVFMKDWEKIYGYNLDGCYGAAVRDMNCEVDGKWNELLGLNYYYNSGVMLLNLELM